MACSGGGENNGCDQRMTSDICKTQWEKLGSWFIGPSAENIDEFCGLAIEAIRQNAKPKSYFQEDSLYITSEVKASPNYKKEMSKLETELKSLNDTLSESIPFANVRYQGHMLADTATAARLGFLAAWMTNANNAGKEGGPVTTQLEIEVGKQLCDLLGFNKRSNPRGYITNGGSSSNIEALWASRNVKFFPLAVQKAIREEPTLADVKDLRVYIPRLDRKQKLISSSTWDLLNLNLDDVISLPQEISQLIKDDNIDFRKVINKYSIEHNGFVKFYRMHGLTIEPVVMTSAAKHFTWEKAATLMGIGGRNLICVPFDHSARTDVVALRRLLDGCLVKKVPVIAIVCIIGTTEHGSVDSIEDILHLRAEYRTKGLSFFLLVDGAWGGYYTTMIRKPEEKDKLLPAFPLSDYVRKQLSFLKDVDTVTIDPHKAGYCPYPAGFLCYRNGQMKSFLAFSTDMLNSTGYVTVNCLGLETSKPGAAAAGVYLAHKVIGLHSSGYGRILGQSILGAKLFYCAWLTAANPDDEFVCVPLVPIPEAYDEESTMQFIREKILLSSYEEIVLDTEVMDFLSEIGPDLPINAFAVNVKNNTCVVKCNRLNMAVFNRLSHTDPKQRSVCDVPMFLTKSSLSQKECGIMLENIKEHLGVSKESGDELVFLKNTVMNPWTVADQTIQMLVQHFRQVVTQCIAEIEQPE
ncbi:L-tyrosine decarboxylase-like [Ylistrum balloti]|uniref:L-tyrosine decarboxylase-like n=1 Tax=Ylistrum balloti TaxID=509963 RepID=UPI002905CE8A|nr:L-tyrosine decarboxylase-like [Ylistrum balloti]